MAELTMKAELEQLQLEEARAAAEDRKQKRTYRMARRQAIEATIKRDNANRARIQASCQHRKGGKGTAQMYMGNDANYAVVTHHNSAGTGTIVVCQRCGKLWEPPQPLPKKPTSEQKAQYRADYAEYRRAINFPTDNEPSGTVLFTFTPPDENLAV
jgi:hypothetical protein